MATRSTIGYVDPQTGYVYSVYCHWDGYPSHNGKILLEHYNSLDRVKALVALGSISSLEPSIECPENHSFDNPVDGHTIFYGRDRGEEDVSAIVQSDGREAVSGEEYGYLFVNGEWKYNYDGSDLYDLTLEEAKINR
jgi:hypothetical protein